MGSRGSPQDFSTVGCQMAERCAISATYVRCERDEGSRSEVRGFRNFEPGTSNFVLCFSRSSRLSQALAITAEAFMNMFGIGLARA